MKISKIVTLIILIFASTIGTAAAADPQPNAAPADSSAKIAPIDYTTETLSNGLQVIYAPLHQAPVVHVRVLYHVGSRDERADRQGFAHMFEHMMFRGSAHVGPEEHMKLIGSVGGYCNAFTTFDETVYHQTLPADHLEMALYLEADRMASFKVSEDIYKTERNVVAEEWRMKQNKPYGNLYEEMLKKVFTTHNYRWTPIGNMDHLRAAGVDELQEFFNTYYLPNNAVLVISGDFDLAKTKAMVHKYFDWIPKGPEIHRLTQPEPPQTDARRADVPMTVPLPAVYLVYQIPPYKSDDQYALSILASILGQGNSSRLDRLLVSSASPLCVDVNADMWSLEDAGILAVGGTVMSGKDPAEVEKIVAAAVANLLEKGVTEAELEKAKTQAKVGIIHGRENANNLAEQLGNEALYTGDADRANREFEKLNAVTVADVEAVAKKYLSANQATTMIVTPDPLGLDARKAAAKAATQAKMDTPVAPSTQKIEPRKVEFPADYPTKPPLVVARSHVNFAKGIESNIDGVRVITMTDTRLPLANLSITLRSGAHNDPAGKEGLSSLAFEMLRHGAGTMSYEKLNQELESRGIALTLDNGGDFLRLSISCTADQLADAVKIAQTILLQPTFPADEFEKLKAQTIDQLRLAEESPQNVGMQELSAQIYGSSSLGRHSTPASVKSITLDEVKSFYTQSIYPHDAIVIFSGDVSDEKGKQLAHQLIGDWFTASPAITPAVAADYNVPEISKKRKIILIDRPDGKQATVRLGLRAYDIHTDEKFAGAVANQILTPGIDSRLMKYVRAEKGLAYSVTGVFQAGRHGGAFAGGVDTRLETTADAVEAMFHVLDGMQDAFVTPAELTNAQNRVAGGLLMQMQTAPQQAQYRVDGILNDYPVDYYDNYPARIAAVTAQEVQDVMKKYVHDGQMAIVVVAPASAVKEQLEKLGDVEVIPMPAKRHSTTQPANSPTTKELLKPAQ